MNLFWTYSDVLQTWQAYFVYGNGRLYAHIESSDPIKDMPMCSLVYYVYVFEAT